MPTPITIPITPGLGLLLDGVSLVVSGNSIIREIMVLADPTNPTSLAGVTPAGALQVDGSGVTQPVSGTITASQATAANLNATVVFGSPQHVIVDSASFTVSENLAQVNSVALGSPSTYGTGPGAVNVIGVNAFITNTPAVTALLPDTAGTPFTFTAAAQTATVALAGKSGCSVTFSANSSFVGNVLFETSQDNGSTWNATSSVNVSTLIPNVGTVGFTPVNGSSSIWTPQGTTNVRARVSAFTSGSIVCVLYATNNTPVTFGMYGSDGVIPRILNTTSAGNPLIGGVFSGADAIPNTRIVGLASGALLEMTAMAPWLYNGTTWDRARSVGTGIQLVGLADGAGSTITLGAKTSANSIPVVLASDEATLPVTDAALGILPLGPAFVQAVASQAGTGISTIVMAFGSSVAARSIILLCAMESAGAIPTFAKTAGTAVVIGPVIIKSGAVAPGYSLAAFQVTTGGTLTITATSGGGASVDMAAYAAEISGLLPAGMAISGLPFWDSIQVSQGTSGSVTFAPFYTETISELPFIFVGMGSAATVSNLSLGDTILGGTTSAATTGGAGNLQQFVEDRPTTAAPFTVMGKLSPTVNFSGSSLYTALYISLKSWQLSVAGSVTANLNRVGGNAVVTASSGVQLVGNADGVGNPLTSNSTTPAAHFALDSNITSILGTAPTTIGKLDVKGADGDIFVRQTTAANLNATVVGTGTFAVQDSAAEASLVQIQQELRQQSAFPNLSQVAAFQSSASATTLTVTFGSSSTLGAQLLLVAMSSTTTKPTFAQTGGTGTVVRGTDLKNSTTSPSVQIDLWRVTVAGTIIMTATFASGACAAIGYEISGLPLSGSLPNSQPFYDSLQISQGTASAATLNSFFTLLPGELPFLFVGLGSASTVSSSNTGTTRLTNFALDGTNVSQNVAASGNLQTFYAGRISGGPLEDMTNMTPAATFSGSSLFTCIYVSFKPVSMPIGGTVGSVLTQIAGNSVISAAPGVQQVGIVGGTGVSLETTAGVLDLNLKNVGNNPVVTGTGVSGAGIPRVTVSSDSIPSVAATGVTAPASAEEIGFVDPQGKLAAVSATAPLPIQTDPQMLQVVTLLTRILACLESMKVMDGQAYGVYANTDDHYDQMN